MIKAIKGEKMNYNLEGKIFTSLSNTNNGEVNENTHFYYHQKGSMVWAEYEGGQVKKGHLIANIIEDGKLDMRYQHINSDGQLMIGRCLSTPEIMENGYLKFKEEWEWLSGDRSKGYSEIVEIDPSNARIYHTKFCKVTYQKNLNAILCQWKAFCHSEAYRNPLRYGLELLNQTKAINWITDTTYGFENRPEDTEWLVERFIPQAIQSSCENLFFIMEEDSPLREEIEEQATVLGEYFRVSIVGSLEEVGLKRGDFLAP